MKPHWIITASLCITLFAACEPASPTPAPDAIALPTTTAKSASAPSPTIASAPSPKISTPTASLSPFVPTLPAPTRAPLLSALNKTQAATIYRAAMELNVKTGTAPAFALNLQGEVNGDDSRYVSKLGNESSELIAIGGQFYVKGARALGAPNLTKWYSVTPDLADAVRFPFSPQEILSALADDGLKQSFQIAARETLDGTDCQVWSYRPSTVADAGIGKGLGLDAPNSAFGTVERAEMKLWVCDDGALHQLSGEIAAHKTANALEKGSLKLQIHVWDFGNAAIKISAPANAEPFQLGAPKP